MKSLLQAVVVAAAITAPVVVFAQANQPVTRAQVRAELVELQQAGYHPGGEDPYYPADIQAAEAKIAAQKAERNATSGVGGVVSGSSDAGRAVVSKGEPDLYLHH